MIAKKKDEGLTFNSGRSELSMRKKSLLEIIREVT